MKHFIHCPIPTQGGGDCWAEPHPASSWGLCVKHWRKIVKQWHDDQPAVNLRCLTCGAMGIVDPVEINFAMCENCGRRMDTTKEVLELVEAERIAAEAPGWVYYIRFGDRIKIGYTTRLETRLSALPHDEVLATEPGTLKVERARHAQFRKYLVEGQREWFHAETEVIDYANKVRSKFGDPLEVRPEEVIERAIGIRV